MNFKKYAPTAIISSLLFISATTNVSAADFCVTLDGTANINVTLDADNNIVGTSAPDILWVGHLENGKIYLSIGYAHSALRPIQHTWDLSTLGGQGRAYNGMNLESWIYSWSFSSGNCPAAISSIYPSTDVVTGQ